MIIGILLLLVLLGGAAGVLGLIVLGTKHNRFGLLAIIGVLAVVGVLMLIKIGLFLSFAPHTVTVQSPAPVWAGGPVNDVARAAAQGLHGNVYDSVSTHQSWSGRIAFVSLPLVALVVFLIVIAIRRLTSPGDASGHQRIWPALLIIPLLAFFFIGSVRFHRSSSNVPATESLVQTGIHQQMDKFDAPRIPLAPSAAYSPPVPAKQVAVARQSVEESSDPSASDSKEKASADANKSESQSKYDEATTPTADSNRRNKKTNKALSGSEPKTSETVAQPKPAKESSGANEKAAGKEAKSDVAAAKSESPATARPAWIDEQPKRTGTKRREVIATDEYESVDECYQAADVYLLLKAYQRMQQLVGRPYVDGPLPSLTFHNGMILADGNVISSGQGYRNWSDRRLYDLSVMGIGTDYVRQRIVAKEPNSNEPREFIETVERSFGPMKKLYLQVEFTPEIDRELRQHWDARQRHERFAIVGVGAGSILGLLSLVFGLLKIDTWTKGYYTKRLFLGVPAAIIGGWVLLLFLDKYTSLL